MTSVWFSSAKTHQFNDIFHLQYETHVTLSLWENFSNFAAEHWVPAIYELANLPSLKGPGDEIAISP